MFNEIDAYLKSFSSHMDYEGQRLAERLFQWILVAAGVIGFGVGYAFQQLSYAVFTVLGAAALSGLIILPPWPFLFRKQNLKWQPVKPVASTTSETTTTQKKKKK